MRKWEGGKVGRREGEKVGRLEGEEVGKWGSGKVRRWGGLGAGYEAEGWAFQDLPLDKKGDGFLILVRR